MREEGKADDAKVEIAIAKKLCSCLKSQDRGCQTKAFYFTTEIRKAGKKNGCS